MAADPGGHFAQGLGAVARRGVPPDPEAFARRGDGGVDVLDRGLGDLAKQLSRSRVAALGPAPQGGRMPSAAVVEVEPRGQDEPGQGVGRRAVHLGSSIIVEAHCKRRFVA